jgi:hypothetical protein
MRRLIAGFGVAALMLAVAPSRSLGQTDDAAGYDFFTVAGVADGITTRLAVKDFLAVEEFAALSTVSAESRLESNRSAALAVLPDPGDLVLALPGTLSGLAGVPGIPDYPAQARAEYPTSPRQEKNLVPDAGLGAARLLAEADEPVSHGLAFVSNMVDTVGLLPGFSVGSIRSETVTRRIDSLAYEAKATTTTNDIRLLGGLVHIGELTNTVTARVDDGRVTASAEETRVSGAELAGTPVGIDADGFTSPNGSQALQPVVDQLAAPLAEQGIAITVTPGSVTQDGGSASAVSGTLRIELKTVLQERYPATISLAFGQAHASVDAGRITEDAGTFDAGTGSDVGGSDLSGGDTGAAGVLGSSLGAAGDLAADTTGAALPAVGGSDTTQAGRPVAAVTDLMDFRSMYKLMALAGAALLAARWWALSQARRRPPAPRPYLRTMWRW